MNKAILKLHEIRLSKTDLELLSIDQRATFAILCFAVSEINCLLKLYLQSEQSLDEKPEIISAIAIQRNMLIRTFSSKVFEVREFLKFEGKYNKTKDPELLSFKKHAQKKCSQLDKLEGYKFAEKIRHESSFHYNLKPTRSRLNWVHKEAIRSLYLHEMSGNCFHPFGEEALFIGLLNEEMGTTDDKEKARQFIDAWATWGASSTRMLNELFADFVTKFIDKIVPDRKFRERVYWIDPDLTGSASTTKISVFLRNDLGV